MQTKHIFPVLLPLLAPDFHHLGFLFRFGNGKGGRGDIQIMRAHHSRSKQIFFYSVFKDLQGRRL